MAEFDILKEYKPEKIRDGFEVFKGNYKAMVNKARIETYDGEREDLKGVKFYRYELEVVDDYDNTGRRLWGSFRLDNEVQLKKLANMMFTLGLEFKSEEELEALSEQFTKLIVNVKAWAWTPPDSEEPRQMHMIKGIADTNPKSDAPSF